VYQLGAVLMHVGKSAYSGHYLAHIKNFETDEWFCFNDEIITKIKKKQELGCTDDEIHTQSTTSTADEQSTTRSSKAKTFSTANAYLLVYYRKDVFDANMKAKKLSELEVKNDQLNIVHTDNATLEAWFSNIQSVKLKHYQTENSGRVTVRSIYDDLWCDQKNTPQDHIYFIPTDFLRKFLMSTNDVISLGGSTQKYMCPHKRLNPFAVNRFKVVSSKGLDTLKSSYSLSLTDIGAFEVNNGDSTTMCMQCIRNIYAYLRFKEDLKNDAKVFRNLVKDLDIGVEHMVGSEQIENNEVKLYWIGKDSMRLWQNLAMKKYACQVPSARFTDPSECIVLSGTESPVEVQQSQVEIQQQTITNDVIVELNENDVDLNVDFAFNDDTRCMHGNLLPGNNKRIISEKCLKFLCKYFPYTSFFSVRSQECEMCQVSAVSVSSECLWLFSVNVF
jgi:ubiquitin carboxyl-terminal hydrolase 48